MIFISIYSPSMEPYLPLPQYPTFLLVNLYPLLSPQKGMVTKRGNRVCLL